MARVWLYLCILAQAWSTHILYYYFQYQCNCHDEYVYFG